MLSPKIKSIKAIEKYKLNIHFQDGISGVYDVSNLAGKGVFKIWDTVNNFFEVFVNPESGAISWPGEIDIDTINVYCQISGISPEIIGNRYEVSGSR